MRSLGVRRRTEMADTLAKPRPYAQEPARYPLIALGAATCVAVVTGTFSYAYPETLAAVRPQLVWVHELAGDAMAAAGAVYLWIHLRRTWKQQKLAVSWWTGVAIALLFAAALVTGLIGQFSVLDTTLYWIHIIASVALVAGACFHGAHGLRRRLR